MAFYFYLARCKDNSLYAGSCINLENREKAHNNGKGAKYTKSRRPVMIVYHEKFPSRIEAMRRETQIKKWSRIKKENLVRYGHPLQCLQLKIAIISDSHGSLDRLGAALENLRNGGVTEIIHAGDFALGEIGKLLQKFPNLNFRIAIGNCDVDEETLAKIEELPNIELAKILEFEIEGRKFAVAHRIEDLAKSQAEILISGHTHIPHIEKIHGKLFVNPGSLMDGGKYILLDSKKLTIEGKLFNEKL